MSYYNVRTSTLLTIPRESLSGTGRSESNDEGGEDRLEIHGSLGCGVVEKRMTRANR